MIASRAYNREDLYRSRIPLSSPQSLSTLSQQQDPSLALNMPVFLPMVSCIKPLVQLSATFAAFSALLASISIASPSTSTRRRSGSSNVRDARCECIVIGVDDEVENIGLTLIFRHSRSQTYSRLGKRDSLTHRGAAKMIVSHPAQDEQAIHSSPTNSLKPSASIDLLTPSQLLSRSCPR